MTLLRRDVLKALLGAPLATSLFASLPSGCASSPSLPRTIAGTLRGPNLDLGHQLRDGQLTAEMFARLPVEHVGCAILGGGPAGLSAAWRLAQQGYDDFALYELEDKLGGTARSGASQVTPYPWGAHYVPMPMAHNEDLRALFQEMNALERVSAPSNTADTDRDTNANSDTDADKEVWNGAEHILVREPESRVFFQGYWYRGLYPYAGANPEDLAELTQFRARIDRYASMRDENGRRAFAIPVAMSSQSAALVALDQISAKDFLTQHGFRSARLWWWVDYACRDDYGLGLADTSAWAMMFYWASRIPNAGEEAMDLLTWPQGNGAIVSHLENAVHGHVQTNQLAVRVFPLDAQNSQTSQNSHSIEIHLFDAKQHRPRRLHAHHCVVALPQFIAQHVVTPLATRIQTSAAGARATHPFRYGPWMVANVHLRGRPFSRGFGPCWDNVLYDSPSLGYITATHQRGRDDGPTVWTYYRPFANGDEKAARKLLHDASVEEWQAAVRADLLRAHPDLDNHLERIDIWRWGHAMVQPRVGFMFSDTRTQASQPIGNIHFAHSDLSGIAIFEEAFYHGVRAADEVAKS